MILNISLESDKSVSIGPGSSGHSAGNDVTYTIMNDGTTLGKLKFYIRAYYSYNTSTNRYSVYYELYAYSTDVSASILYVRLPKSSISFGNGFSVSDYSSSWASNRQVRSIEDSYTYVARSNTGTFSPGTSSSSTWGNAQISPIFEITSSNTNTRTTTTPKVNINMGSNKFTIDFSSNGNPSSYPSQSIYYGATPSNPGTPSPPSTSLSRTVSVRFTPTNGNESAITSSRDLMDSWNTPSWGLGPVYGSKTFHYDYERQYNTTPVTIPAWATSNGKPTRNGYNFSYWNYSGNNIGSEPNTDTNYSFGSGGTTTYDASAVWNETESEYFIYPKYKIGDNIYDVTFTPDDGTGTLYISKILKWTETWDISAMQFKSFLKNGLRVNTSAIYNSKNNTAVQSISGKSQDKEYYVLYDIIQDQVTLDLNGGNINGSTASIVIPYNRFSEVISIKSEQYKPVKENTTFVAWVKGSGTSTEYVDQIDPAEQDVWPSNITLKAEYIPIGFFIARKDRSGKLIWEAIVNKWVFHNDAWQGEYEIEGTDIVHTSTRCWVLTQDGWKLEYGKHIL